MRRVVLMHDIVKKDYTCYCMLIRFIYIYMADKYKDFATTINLQIIRFPYGSDQKYLSVDKGRDK